MRELLILQADIEQKQERQGKGQSVNPQLFSALQMKLVAASMTQRCLHRTPRALMFLKMRGGSAFSKTLQLSRFLLATKMVCLAARATRGG